MVTIADAVGRVARPAPLPRTATVLAVAAGGMIDVRAAGHPLKLPIVRGLAPAVGDVVLLSGSWVVGRTGTTTSTYPAPGPELTAPRADTGTVPVPAITSGQVVLFPVWTGEHLGGDDWRPGRVARTADGRNGVAFYGAGPAGMAAGRTLTAGTIGLTLAGSSAGTTVSLQLVTESTRPAAGGPTTGGTGYALGMASRGVRTELALPAPVLAALAAGTAGGLALAGTGVSGFSLLGLGETDPAPMTLTLDWTS